MAKKKGHTPISNELLEEICSGDFTKAELKVLLAGIRKILGWKSRRISCQDHISLSQFSKLTGLTDRGVSKALKYLQKREIFTLVLPGSGRRSNLWHFNTSTESWLPVERTPVPPTKEKGVEHPFPLRDEKTPKKRSENTQNGPGWNTRSTQGGTPVPPTTPVERTPVLPQKKDLKETYPKERRTGARLASLIEKTFQTFLHDPDFKLNDGEVEIIKGVIDRYSTSSPEHLITSFRNFLGCREKIERKTIPIWAPQAGTYLATQSKHDGFRQAGSMARMPRARATE